MHFLTKSGYYIAPDSSIDLLPGLGGGKDPDIIEIDKPTEIITDADRARIARYHSYTT